MMSFIGSYVYIFVCVNIYCNVYRRKQPKTLFTAVTKITCWIPGTSKPRSILEVVRINR